MEEVLEKYYQVTLVVGAVGAIAHLVNGLRQAAQAVKLMDVHSEIRKPHAVVDLEEALARPAPSF